MHFYNQLGTAKNVQHGTKLNTKLKFNTTFRLPPQPIPITLIGQKMSAVA